MIRSRIGEREMKVSNKEIIKLESLVIRCFEQSKKRHLFITGSKKSGKTTILNAILKEKSSVGGIITDVVRDNQIPPKYVVLSDFKKPAVTQIIARRNDSNTSLIPICETFETFGVSILKQCIESDLETIVIDEIGFLEDKAPNYQRLIMECLNQKKVIFVLRKQETQFIERIKSRQDAYLIDMDEYRRN